MHCSDEDDGVEVEIPFGFHEVKEGGACHDCGRPSETLYNRSGKKGRVPAGRRIMPANSGEYPPSWEE